ncbi:MAG: acetyl-CoA C-acyltransferase [Bdellovibrionaceae bacterium]|nr:acetyl-CoA C-acyltransferase [Pseudobdellovibrionaceae bacterium]|tara:strand:+ start:135588 stop:136868 length:1281 start_codon:yes stop_codon:yes gene_type:complete
MSEIRRVAIVGGQRIPFCRSSGKYMGISNRELVTHAVNSVVAKYNLSGKEIGEVVLGAVVKHSSDWNLARETVLGTQLHPATPAYDIQQACGTSLESCMLVANKIALGQIDVGIGAGTDTNSDIPVVFKQEFAHRLLRMNKQKSPAGQIKELSGILTHPSELLPKLPGVTEPRTKLSMGQHCELMAKEWNISREEQDELAYLSHKTASEAYEAGWYNDLVVPFNGVEKDNNVRPDTSIEKLAKLRTAYDRSEKGTLTAGNSTPLTDGAAAVLLCSEEYAKQNDLPVLAYLTHCQTAAVDHVKGDGLLIAPTVAVAKMIQRAGIKLQDFDFYEIHEAFAAQVLCTLKAWESEEYCSKKMGLSSALGSIDRSKMNVRGGSLAVGHPFAATGARIVAGLAKMIDEAGSGRGLISVCTAGGMGVTAILEK